VLALLTIDVQEDFAGLISGTLECVPAVERVLAAFRQRFVLAPVWLRRAAMARSSSPVSLPILRCASMRTCC